MLSQRLIGDQNDMTGTLTITAEAGALPELMGLHEELKLRANITTLPTGMTLPSEGPPPPTGG